jgi:predicted ABC-type ATPase
MRVIMVFRRICRRLTVAPRLLADVLHVGNSSTRISSQQGISAFRPEEVSITAGRLMLQRLRELTAQRVDVAFESTLASRSFAPWIRPLIAGGYAFHIFSFGCLPRIWRSIAFATAS